jgi:transcription initiation factor TFIID TATA-box-binding protein
VPADFRVRNVVASAGVAQSLRLEDLAAGIPGAMLDLRFPRVVFRHSAPKVTALAFGSGRVVLTGLTDPATTPLALAAVLTVLRDAGAALDEPAPKPTIVNLVASGSLGGRVLLRRLVLARDFDRVEFDPEQFPGLVYRPEAGGVALVFGTGSFIVTGARSVEGAEAIAAEVRSVIDESCAWIPL